MNGTALITGGTGAIGAAIATSLQAAGMDIIVADLDPRPVPEGQQFIAADLTDPESMAALLDRACKTGPLACVVLAHGILLETPAGSAKPADISRVLSVNLTSIAAFCNAVGDRMTPGASIVLISSVTAFMGRVRNAHAYQASKAGIESLTRSFAIAYGERGIRVNCIAPGFMSMPMKGAGAELRARQGGSEAVRQVTPLGKLVTPEQLAKAARFLVSDEAEAITGIVLPVDAGLRAY